MGIRTENISLSKRLDFIRDNIGEGNIIDSFLVDNGDPHGAEIHKVTSTALIMIHNAITQKFITVFIARPEQLRRLYRSDDREPPRHLIKLAYDHNRKGYNNL